jgi:hypothetical protein
MVVLITSSAKKSEVPCNICCQCVYGQNSGDIYDSKWIKVAKRKLWIKVLFFPWWRNIFCIYLKLIHRTKKQIHFVPHKIKCNENIKFKPTMLLLTAVAISFLSLSWGIVGHEKSIKRQLWHYQNHCKFSFNHWFYHSKSTVPDLRIYTTRQSRESRHYYFDMENFGSVE